MRSCIKYLQNNMITKQIHIQPKLHFSACDYRTMANLESLPKKDVMSLFKMQI